MLMFSVGWNSSDDPAAAAIAVVDVVLARAALAQGVDEAAVFGVVADHPQGGLVRQRQVDHALQ
jgi:hypothetical protein